MDALTAKREALWHFLEARLGEIAESLDLPVLEEPRLMEALEAGYLAALEDFAPALHRWVGGVERNDLASFLPLLDRGAHHQAYGREEAALHREGASGGRGPRPSRDAPGLRPGQGARLPLGEAPPRRAS